MKTPDIKQGAFIRTPHRQHIHLSDYLAVLKKRKSIVFLFFLFVVGAVTLYSFLVTPTYIATAQIIISAPTSPLNGREEASLKGKQARDDFLNIIYQQLASSEVAEKVVAEFNTKKSNSLDRKYTVPQHLASLKLSPLKSFGLSGISVSNPSAEDAALLANLHAEKFIEARNNRIKERNTKNFQWLTKQLEEQKIKVETANHNLYVYQKNSGILSTDRNDDIVKQKLSALNSALIQAQTDKEAKETAFEELQKISPQDKSIFSNPLILQDKLITDLRSQQISLHEQKAEMAAEYGENHPKIIEITKKLHQLSGQLTHEINRVILLSKEDVARAVALEKSARLALEEHKKGLVELQAQDLRYDLLKKEAESNQVIYDSLLAEARKVNLASKFDENSIYIVEKAIPPKRPASPKTALNLILASILGLVLGSGLAFFAEYMDNKVWTDKDVGKLWDLPVLGVLPDRLINPENSRLDKASPTGEDYSYPYLPVLDWLPVKMKINDADGAGTALHVGSAAKGDGKTSVLARIAVRLGQAGFKTLAADCDFQRPSLGDLFFAKNSQPGISDVIKTISTVDVSSGYLADCSISDLFILVDLHKLSGKLSIMNEGQIIISTFKNGRLLSIEGAGSKKQNKLGSMLLEKGFLTTEQFNEVFKKHAETGHPFGYVLLNSGYVSQNKLQRLLKGQTENNLQKLFSWKNGTFAFLPNSDETLNDEKIYFADSYDKLIQELSKMSESLLFDINIQDYITTSQYQNVDFLAAGSTPAFPNQRLLSTLITHLKTNYDFVLLDGPPVLDASDATAIAQMADGIIFVIKSGQLTSNEIQKALDRIASANSNIMGIVLNQVKVTDFIH